jgi:tungstate transport system permease protein
VNPYHHDFVEGLHQALQIILHGNSLIVHTTLRTLRLAVVCTALGALIGVPLGCVLGLGRSAASRLLLTAANAMTRIPPVVAGVIVLLVLTQESPWGGGPLASLQWYGSSQSGYMAQTLLAVPIVIVLTASAVRGVPAGLLDQARAYGASGYRRAALAVREARRAVIAAIVVAMGVTITSIGALVVAGTPQNAKFAVKGGYNSEPATLALGAFQSFTQASAGTDPHFDPSGSLGYPTQALGVAYGTVLLGLFILIAAGLTWLQETRGSLIRGLWT